MAKDMIKSHEELTMGNRSVTISIPGELLELADRLAKQRHTSRSSVITAFLTEGIERYQAEETALAYRDWAAEGLAIAAETRTLAAKQLTRINYDA